MPKPQTKKELQKQSQENFDSLNTFIDSLSEDNLNAKFPPGTMNRNIRDVLAHLHHWHILLIDWYKEGMKGKKPYMPAKGYSWKETPLLNKKIWEDYQSYSLSEVRELLQISYDEVKRIIKKHTDRELFEKKRYQWTGSTSLGAYLIANTSSHYKWAYQLIKKQLKV